MYDRCLTGRVIRSHNHGWYVYNNRGDVVQRLGNGYVRHTYRYCAFGVELFPSLNNTNRFRWGGMYWDAHTQTYYTQFRHYNPRTGRWLSEDPHWGNHNRIFGDSPTMMNDRYVPSIHAILQAGNLYMFTMHNPVFWADSSGLFATPANVIGAILGAGGGAMLGRMVADHFNITGWRRTATIAGFTIGGAAIGWFAPGVINSLANSLAISLGLMTTGGVLLGTDFGKLGVLIKNKGQQVVNWAVSNSYALGRMSERGVTQSMVDLWVRTGYALQQTNGRILYITKQGAAVINSAGELVTTYSSKYFDANMRHIVEQLFGR